MISAFPKIFAIGQDYIRDIFDGEVEISEKIDGSQFVFGKIEGEVYIRSKGSLLWFENPEKMFSHAIDYIDSIREKIPEGFVYYCGYLKNPKHNTLAYERVPINHLILFGVALKGSDKFYKNIDQFAETLDIEPIPILYRGSINSIEEILQFTERISVLGKSQIEGIVVKNYSKPFLLGGQPIPIMAGKYVCEKFKEVHREKWSSENTAKGQWETFKESFRTEARWNKAVQHLKERGELEISPRDIGKLIKEIQIDIQEEEKENIKNWLYQHYGKEIIRKATAGFPEWYKEELLKNAFAND